ncbi:MAG: 4Fe-4S binding protein [Deltaproteobacteria bacterium]|nr:4Fe-4S binding protein [Deltaproteobacteria bacterium]
MADFDDSHDYIRIDEKRCTGCVLCMKACPTKAIRVRKGIARIEGPCIYCGECIRACPKGAIKAITNGDDFSSLARHPILSVSPVFYTQFLSVSPVFYTQSDRRVMPNDILLALRRRFNYVYDQAYMNELFNLATEWYIRKHHSDEAPLWPLISPNCPVVNRIIAQRFQSLMKHLLPIITPRELVAKYLKERLRSEGVPLESIGVYDVTPCAAEMISIREPVTLQKSYLDGALGMSELFNIVHKSLREIDTSKVLHQSGGIGLGWGMSGGEIEGLNSGKYLAVSGIKETIRYLEKLEMGLLSDIEYVEFRACPEGCIGGPMALKDRYQAKNNLRRLVRMFGTAKRIHDADAERLFSAGWFFIDRKDFLERRDSKRLPISEAIRRQGEVEKTLKLLPGKECGACGSPDCRTFAEDVVDGRASLEDCVFVKPGFHQPIF